MMTREQVYQKISGQITENTRTPRHGKLRVETWLVYIKGAFYDTALAVARDEAWQEYMLQVATLCVQSMMANGLVARRGNVSLHHEGGAPTTEVLRCINYERDYQDHLPDSRTDRRPHSVQGYICMLDTYLHRAVDGWTRQAGDVAALDNIRKLAGIAVRCLEELGGPQ